MSEATLHSVVVPVFNEVEGLEVFHQRCRATLEGLGEPYELIYVDDGSHDGSWRVMSTIADREPNVRLVRLSRNFGHQVAITAGMECATGATVTVIDADLQDPPEVIAELLARWRTGADVVYAVRTTGVYCQPSSTARRPKRENVAFFETAEAAEAAGALRGSSRPAR